MQAGDFHISFLAVTGAEVGGDLSVASGPMLGRHFGLWEMVETGLTVDGFGVPY